ncbi:MAG: amidoligase family protein [Pseudomonadales bacterium]|nr:amidoligase family protein [Pseudomonadales bacterium]
MYYVPDALKCAETGETRRVGIEIEFAGLTLEQTADILAAGLDGTTIPDTEAECLVKSPDHGEFKIELDWQFGKELARDRQDEYPNDPAMEWLTSLASQVVPVEVVCPPIAVDQLEVLDAVTEELRKAGGVGTFDSFFYAFGVHLNPELPDTRTKTIIRYLKAFLLAQEWLIETHKVDLSRRITPYIDLFDTEYTNIVLDYPEDVTEAQLIDDYLAHNPTRNRGFDMTPLFRHLDEKRLVTQLDDDRINARQRFTIVCPTATWKPSTGTCTSHGISGASSKNSRPTTENLKRSRHSGASTTSR